MEFTFKPIGTVTLKKPFLSSVYLLIALQCLWAEMPITRNDVAEIAERSKQNPKVLLELKGAPLDVIMPKLREIWGNGEEHVKTWNASRRAGREREFLAMEASVHRDPKYFAEAYPLARDILLSHPDF